MSSKSQPSVLITGAGPSGLILALTLAQNGVPVRIIEKDIAFHRGQRGSGIMPRTLELLNYLGCLQDFMEQSTLGSRVCIYKMPGGREIAQITGMATSLEPTADVPFRNPRVIGQSHNEAIVRSHLAKYNVKVELGAELVGFVQDKDGVTAELLHHDKRMETVRVEYLIGADGARSIVRKQLGLTFLGQTTEEARVLLVDLYIRGIDSNYWHLWGDFHTKAIWMRKTEYNGLFSVLLGGPEVDINALAADHDALFKFFREFTNHPEMEFGEVICVSEFRPNIRMANKFGDGRIFLVGDAAHVHSPAGGQGLNTGVQDSFNFGWKLSLVCKGLAAPCLLETYTDERLPVVREMLGLTTALLEKMAAYRASSADASHVRRDKAWHQLGVNYRWSAIVVDEQGEAEGVSAAYGEEDPLVLRAGDRAPNAPGLRVLGTEDETESLFSIFRPTHHTVLLFASHPDEVKPTVEVLKASPAGTMRTVLVLPMRCNASDSPQWEGAALDAVVVDQDGHAHTYYPPVATGHTIIVIRPDGVVGAVVKSADGLKTYLNGVFGR